MNHKTLAVILIVLLGGMAIYYKQSTSSEANGAKIEKPAN